MLFKRLELKNLLSFQDTKVDLRPLNVLIGANGSGKSNLIDVISLLQATPTNLSDAIRQGGGARSWLSMAEGAGRVAGIVCEVDDAPPLQYKLSLSEESNAIVVVEESLSKGSQTHFTRRGSSARRRVSRSGFVSTNHIPASESFFSVYKNPNDPTRITQTGKALEAIRIYRDFTTSGSRAASRYGATVSAPKDHLSETGDNLALMLQALDFQGRAEAINGYLKRFWDRYLRFKVNLEGSGFLQTYLFEKGLERPVSAARLSDGTLKFLCLLATLLNAAAPPLTCIEEPEVGLHPEAIPIVADLLIEASARMQLIVTTHSEALVDALSHRPDDVLVCERDFDGGTQFKRLDKKKLGDWLERYTLGELWRKGEFGGTRW
jgi:predicted ATPase